MVKSICRAVSGIGICVGFISALLAFVAFVRIFDVPSGLGWRYPYVLNFFALLVIFVLSMLVAVGAFKVGAAIQEEIGHLRIRVIEIEKKMDAKQKEIDSLRKKINDIKRDYN